MFKTSRCIIILLLLSSCVSITRPPSATTTGPRTIILGDTTVSEDDVGGFTSWYCRDFVYEEKGILLEFGYFNDSIFSGMGFVLYDGGYTGEFAIYQRTGIEHRWDWGPDGNYSFVIKADGIGLYYDFTNVEKGQSIKAKDVFKCYKR
jgi:hypothetical protein